MRPGRKSPRWRSTKRHSIVCVVTIPRGAWLILSSKISPIRVHVAFMSTVTMLSKEYTSSHALSSWQAKGKDVVPKRSLNITHPQRPFVDLLMGLLSRIVLSSPWTRSKEVTGRRVFYRELDDDVDTVYCRRNIGLISRRTVQSAHRALNPPKLHV